MSRFDAMKGSASLLTLTIVLLALTSTFIFLTVSPEGSQEQLTAPTVSPEQSQAQPEPDLERSADPEYLRFYMEDREVFNKIGIHNTPSASGKNKISITVNFPSPNITMRGDYHRVEIEGLQNAGNAGEPLLHSKTVMVLIPYGSEVKGVNVSPGEKVDLGGSYRVEPGQMPIPLGFEGHVGPTPSDERIYGSHSPFPAGINSDFFIQIKRGYRILILSLYPVSYVPAEGRLSYLTSMTVEVEIEPCATGAGLPVRTSTEDRRIVSEMVDNPEAINTYSSESPELLSAESQSDQTEVTEAETSQEGLLSAGSQLDPNQSYEYVIITNEALKNASGGLY